MRQLSMPRGLALVAALLSCAMAARADPLDVTGLPMDLTVLVQEQTNPGGNVYSNTQAMPGVGTTPKTSDELLYTTRGINASGRSTQITTSFASALAESDGNGGVGVSSWLAGPGSLTVPMATDRLVAQASWQQSFTYNGTLAAALKMHVEIPSLIVGLIGVAPNRDGVSKTESAQTMVSLSSVITHADGSTTQGGHFEYGMRADEYQIPLGPGVYANFGDITITNDIFQNTLTRNNDDYNPEWVLGAVSADISMGNLIEGDTVSYVYSLLATGTTLGYEHGYYAFIGDPFGLSGVSGNLAPSLALVSTDGPGTVPEPPTLAMVLAALGGLAWRRRGGG